MKRTIINPHKVNQKLYVFLVLLSLIILFISLTIQVNAPKESSSLSVFADAIKNLSYGCIASTLVAWIIDIANTRNLNKKANDIYDSIYGDLQFRIGAFIATWAELCAVAFKDKNYYEEKYTWAAWYEITKENYHKCEPNQQKHLLDFFYGQLSYAEKEVNKSIEYLQSQRYMLTMNDAMNDEIDGILSDFQFEFHALALDLSHRDDPEMFWEHMDAIAKDLVNYIENWADIRYYNVLLFKPYGFFKDLSERIAAMLKSERMNADTNNKKPSIRKQVLIQKISNVKRIAKRDSRGSSYIQIQIATKRLQEFYSNPDIMRNQSFLLWRYTELEKRERIWNSFWIPLFFSIFTFECLSKILQTVKTDTGTIIDILKAITHMEIWFQVVCYGLAILFVVGICTLVYYFVHLIKLITNSFTRNPASTIVENELCILRTLLRFHEIVLDENSEMERIKALFNDKD